MQPEGNNWVVHNPPEEIVFEVTTEVGLQGAGIEITQPGLFLHLRPKFEGDRGCINVALYCDILNGGLGLQPQFYWHSLRVLQMGHKDNKLCAECEKSWIIPCSISSFKMKFDDEDFHFVSHVPGWTKGTADLKIPGWLSSKTYRHLHDKVMKNQRAQRSRRENDIDEASIVFPYEFVPQQLVQNSAGMLELQESPHNLVKPPSSDSSFRGRPFPEYEDQCHPGNNHGRQAGACHGPPHYENRRGGSRDNNNGSYLSQEGPLHDSVGLKIEEDKVKMQKADRCSREDRDTQTEAELRASLQQEERRQATEETRKFLASSTQTTRADRRRRTTTDSYLSHWESGNPKVKPEKGSVSFQFGPNVDMLSGGPLLSSPITRAPSPPSTRQSLASPPPNQNLFSTPLAPKPPVTIQSWSNPNLSLFQTPLQPIPEAVVKQNLAPEPPVTIQQNLAPKPPDVGEYIEELKIRESNRNFKVADMMARGGESDDFESQLGFTDRYRLVHSTEESSSSEESDTPHKTMTECLSELHNSQQSAPVTAGKNLEEKEATKKSSPLNENEAPVGSAQNERESHVSSQPVIEGESTKSTQEGPVDSTTVADTKSSPPAERETSEIKTPTGNEGAEKPTTRVAGVQGPISTPRERLAQPVEVVMARKPMRIQPVDGAATTEFETDVTSAFEANESEGLDLPSGCEKQLDQLASSMNKHNLEEESVVLKKQLEKRAEILVTHIRHLLGEIEKMAPEFYKDLLEISEIKVTLVDYRALGRDPAEQLYALIDVEAKLRNCKNDIKKDSSIRRSARQVLKTKKSFKDC